MTVLTQEVKNRPDLKVIEGGALVDATDFQLIRACQAGETKAFNKLMLRHKNYIQSQLYKMAPDWREQHEDMTQEAMVRVWRSIGTLKNPAAFKGWLRQVITNHFYDQLRKKPRFNVVSLDAPLGDDEDSASRDIPDERGQPDEMLERKEIVESVQRAIALLPDNFRNVLVLRELHGLPYEDIAQITNSELGTVKSRIARARIKVQSSVKHLRTAS
jgi:RNA polymerase sigma-70 factor (ECF subfamily)